MGNLFFDEPGVKPQDSLTAHDALGRPIRVGMRVMRVERFAGASFRRNCGPFTVTRVATGPGSHYSGSIWIDRSGIDDDEQEWDASRFEAVFDEGGPRG